MTMNRRYDMYHKDIKSNQWIQNTFWHKLDDTMMSKCKRNLDAKVYIQGHPIKTIYQNKFVTQWHFQWLI